MSTAVATSGQALEPVVETGGVTAMDIATTKSAQEVQAAMVIAKRFPRNETASIARIVRSCQRPGLAERAVYSYPKGGSQIEGPSIRLAEVMMQGWGNIDCGVIELDQNTVTGESSLMAYAWDLETNSRVTKVFTVKHERSKRSGNVRLTDPRDIYEMVANQGARRLRACIMAVIPGDIQDRAVAECNKTLAGKSDKPLADRVTDMVLAFAKFGVTEEMILGRLGHNLDAMTEHQLVDLRKIYVSLKDGMSDRFDWFVNPATVSHGHATTDDLVKAAEAQQAEANGSDEPAPEAGDDAPTDDEMIAGEQADQQRRGELFPEDEGVGQ